MREASYDAIVIGAGIGGLGVSALLAKAGKRVLTLEREGEIGGRVCSFEYRGHTLSIGGPRAGIEGGEVDRLFAAVGVEQGERAYFDGFRHYRDGRFMDVGELARRASPEERRRYLEALNEVPEAELHRFDDVNAWDYLSTKIKAPELLDLARYMAIGMCTLPRLEDMAASTVMKAARIAQSMPRPYLCVDGYGDYMRILAEASQRHGGELLTEARVERIVIEGGRVSGVEACIGGVMSSRRERFRAPVVIAAFPVWELFRFAPATVFPGEFVDQVQYLARPTAIFGFTAALREPAYEENYFLLGDAPRAGYPLAGYMATNACPQLAPEGEHRLELSCICEYELGSDRQRLDERIALLEQDVEEMYPGWESEIIWQKSYFHLVESARTPGREGVNRPGPRAPGVDGLYLTGDTVSSRALPGLETAADSAMICADAILR